MQLSLFFFCPVLSSETQTNFSPQLIASSDRQEIKGTLDSNSDKAEKKNGTYFMNFYELKGEAGETITIELISDDFDALLILLDPDEEVIATNNDGGENYNAKIVITLPQTGIYLVGVTTAKAGELGKYELIQAPATQKDITLAEANRLNDRVLELNQQGKSLEAIPLAQKVLEMVKSVYGNQDHSYIAGSLSNLAVLYQSEGKSKEAEPLFLDALAMNKRLYQGDHFAVAIILNNLAVLYESQERLGEAELFYLKVLAMNKRLYQGDHRNVATNLNNLAELYREQGRLKEAEPLYLDALAMHKRLYQNDHFAVATSLNNLALLYQAQERFKKAEALLLNSLAMRERLYEDDHPAVATSLNNLAELYREQRRLKEAEPLYLDALAMKKRLYEGDHPTVATSVSNLALLYREQGRLKEAEPLYLDALAMRKRLYQDDHRDVAISLNNSAELFFVQNQIPQTIKYLGQSTEMEENLLLRNLTGSEAQKRAYLATFSFTKNFLISVHQQFAINNSNATNLALTNIFRRKGRILDSATETISLIRQNVTPENQKLLDRLIEVRSELSSLSAERTLLKIKDSEGIPISEYNRRAENLNQKIAQLETQADTLEAQLARSSDRFRVETEKVTIQAVQKQITADTTLIEIMLYSPYNPQTQEYDKPRYVAYTLTKEGNPQSIDLGEAQVIDEKAQELVTLIKKLENANVRRNEDRRKKNLEEVSKASRELDEIVMKPIRDLLAKNTKHLLIAPDSQLNLIPFEALKDENNQYLVKNYAISYLTSGRDLLRFQIKAEPKSNAVVVANPDYGASDEEIIASNTENNNRSVDLFSLKWCCKPLKTKEEAEAISPLLDNPTLLMQLDATESAIKQIKAPKILHIATHGYFLPDRTKEIHKANRRLDDKVVIDNSENPLLRSGLALAGFNPIDNQFEGNLTALEVTSINLYGTKLVVLSACDTGSGDVRNGDGVYGLRRALVLAGSQSQIISLWQVEDNSTKKLMVSYYQKLNQGKGRHEALRETQLELINSEDDAHPYYWAAFIPSGNWRSLDEK